MARDSGFRPRGRGLIRVRTRSFSCACEPLEPRRLLAVDVLTWHNNNLRTGVNAAETVLTPANVNAASFGRLGRVAVDGQVYAQPLIKTGVSIPGMGVHNVVYVATEHDSVYAFDATTLAPLWHVSFLDPAHGVTTMPSTLPGLGDIGPEVGITSTPVIDPASGTLYVVAVTQRTDATGTTWYQTLHALDLATGAEKLSGPVVISATVPGTGAGSVDGQITFDARYQNQRAALLLDHGQVYITTASYGDYGPYHGWVFAYNATTLQQTAAFLDTPDGIQGGIWMSGAGPAADASGAIYLSTGNGTFLISGTGTEPSDLGDSVLKLAWSSTGQLTVASSFTPADQAALNTSDLDLDSGGVVLLPTVTGPHPQLLVTAGKQGVVYLLDRTSLGGYTKNDAGAVQEVSGIVRAMFSTPAYFAGTLYEIGAPVRVETSHPVYRALQAISLTRGKLQTPVTSAAAAFAYPGATPSISANGTKNGIVWAVTANGYNQDQPAVLLAYQASNIHHLLYSSGSAGPRNACGPAVKFVVPTVANGRVYVGGNGMLTMFGLLPPPRSTPRPMMSQAAARH